MVLIDLEKYAYAQLHVPAQPEPFPDVVSIRRIFMIQTIASFYDCGTTSKNTVPRITTRSTGTDHS